jgi:hypothetical protein
MNHVRGLLNSSLAFALLAHAMLAYGQGAGACRADQQPGIDASAKINYCLNNVLHWNGIVDATALSGSQTLSRNMFDGMPAEARIVPQPTPANVTIFFGTGTYSVQVTQMYEPTGSPYPKSIRLIGAGGNLYNSTGTVFKWTGASSGTQPMFVLYNIENLLVQAITFDGNTLATKAMVYAGTCFHPDGGTFEDVVTRGFRINGTDAAIDALGSYGWGAQNVHFYNSSIFGGAVGLLGGSTELKTFGGNFGGEAGITRPAAPTLSYAPGGNLPATAYHAQATYVNSLGETYVSPESSITVPADNLLVVSSPRTPKAWGATPTASGWNVYVSTVARAETKQNSSPIRVGTNWTEPTDGLIGGAPAPAFNTTGSLAAVAFSTSSSLQMVSPTFVGYGTAFLDVANGFVGLVRVQNGWFENDGYLLRRYGSGSNIFLAGFSCLECHYAQNAKYAVDTTGLAIPNIVLFGGYADPRSNTTVNLADNTSSLTVFGPDAGPGWSATGAGKANFWSFSYGAGFDGNSSVTFSKGLKAQVTYFTPTSDPSCGAGQYFIWASSASGALKVCSNGRVAGF